MQIFKIDLMVTSKSTEFGCLKTEDLKSERVYGLLSIRIGDERYGTYIEELANELHPQDDLYCWIETLLEALICILKTDYCAISDLESSSRWIEFIVYGLNVKISVIEADNAGDLMVTQPFIDKKIIIKGAKFDKGMVIKEIIDTASKFIESVMDIEPRFVETDQHKRVVYLLNDAVSSSKKKAGEACERT